ncbi:hypothetical protein ABFS82_10G102200 [Erythranthe guttata]
MSDFARQANHFRTHCMVEVKLHRYDKHEYFRSTDFSRTTSIQSLSIVFFIDPKNLSPFSFFFLILQDFYRKGQILAQVVCMHHHLLLAIKLIEIYFCIGICEYLIKVLKVETMYKYNVINKTGLNFRI